MSICTTTSQQILEYVQSIANNVFTPSWRTCFVSQPKSTCNLPWI